MTSADKKRSAAEASLEFVEPGMILGIGTGSTVNFLIDMLPGIRTQFGDLRNAFAIAGE